MRLKVEGLEHCQGRGIHADVHKEIAKKGLGIILRFGLLLIPLRIKALRSFSTMIMILLLVIVSYFAL
ncbi:hypothetical protein GIB67_031018 [Kingdonia uniflora]|uniref:Uncharacterized protein n=1 Tax=Kingdonia uniflora TaxID=39325 RepID=A0A7J7NGT2_9MAGN|nr:hypothetical protein GIB67_031018 [Kingdonia uniflora]